VVDRDAGAGAQERDSQLAVAAGQVDEDLIHQR
jgi:hypothetical protein